MIDIEQMPEFPVEPEVAQEIVADLTVPPAEKEMIEPSSLPDFMLSLLSSSMPDFMLSLFQIADQARIIHFQTDSAAEHNHFGTFYEDFSELMDALIESIAGKYGIESLRFGQAQISLYDRREIIQTFFEVVDQTLRDKFCSLFDRDKDSELYSIVDDMLAVKNKAQYLLQMKRH